MMMTSITVIANVIQQAITTIQGNRDKSRDIGTLIHYSWLASMVTPGYRLQLISTTESYIVPSPSHHSPPGADPGGGGGGWGAGLRVLKHPPKLPKSIV